MADTDWNAASGGALPTAPILGWTEKLANNSIRTETDGGPAKVRRRFTSTPTVFEMPFVLTEAQATTLVELYEVTTAGGQRTFDGLDNPRTDTEATWRFVSPPEITCEERDIFRTTLTLEELP